MHITDPKYFLPRLTNVDIYLITINEKEMLCFDWGWQTPDPMKSQLCNTRVCRTYDGELHCCQCTYKISGFDEEEINSKKS